MCSQAIKYMETIQDYHHIETREELFDSKELPTYIPLMTHIQTLRKNDTAQDSICHRTPPNQGTGQFQIREIMITGTAFVDLSAAYNTVNHSLLIQKLYNTTLDSQLYRVIQKLLSDRRFYVQLNNERSRWRIQKNGLPPYSTYTRTISQSSMERGVFIYAGDLCITAQ